MGQPNLKSESDQAQPRLQSDRRHDLADLVGEHQIDGLVERPQHRAGHHRQCSHREEASLGVGESRRPSVEVDLRPPQAENFATHPAGQDREPCSCDHRREYAVDSGIIQRSANGR
jgi:hypothetical protein